MNRLIRFVSLCILLLLALGQLAGYTPVRAQEARRPIDMMILIDNSCSMFPVNQIIPGCDTYGSDPGFLRITGADLFVARLGFAEPNEAQYQLGVISIGRQPEMISQLLPLAPVRNALAAKIDKPTPQLATQIIPALQMAYDELKKSPRANKDHMPAIVMITDGVPWPRELQSNAEIQALISKNTDVPLFVMLLKSQNNNSADYNSYISFWQGLQTQYTFVFTYPISEASQIEETYNRILAQLQNTVPSKGITVDKNTTANLSVGIFTNRLIITVVRPEGTPEGSVIIKDPKGVPLNPKDPGVSYFKGTDNPIEVYSITPPRLTPDLQDKPWTVSSSQPVTILVDRQASYSFSFRQPAVLNTDLANQFLVSDRQPYTLPIQIQFTLLDNASKPVTDPQAIRGNLLTPDQVSVPLSLDNVKPDGNGVYQIQLDLGQIYPTVASNPGRYAFIFNAGHSDPTLAESAPIASARLLMDIGNIPFIRSVAPLPLACTPGSAAQLRVSLGDLSADEQDSARVKIFSGDKSIVMDSLGQGSYQSDITSLCGTLIASAPCGGTVTQPLTIRLDVTTANGASLPPSQRDIEVNVTSPGCTATPVATATLVPQPTATPVPDRDNDGINDLADRCPSEPGFAPYGGCFPWEFVYGGSGILVVVAILGLWGYPWLKVNYISPPPEAYLTAIRDGLHVIDPIPVRKVGRRKLHSRVSVGGSRSADISIAGLKPVEYLIEWQGEVVFIREPNNKIPFAYFDKYPRNIHTSNPKVTLQICLNKEELGGKDAGIK